MEKPIITINEGKIQGTTLKSILGQNYLAFKGIPFAQPPLGNLRFREPQPPSKWSGVRDASRFMGTIPTQKETVGQPPFDVIGGEDCLYLNVYTNAIGHKRPVMFYIYGGGFVEGNGNFLYKEDYFMSTDIILVISNYRLGPLGFLNLGHEVASGNQGIKDVIFALKWVQRNIEAFGGDPNNVTIFGNSAGSIISHLFTLIPTTKKLFHKAILQSGSCYLFKRLMMRKNSKNGFKIASFLGMDSEDPEEVVEFLRSVPAEKLVALEGHLLTDWEKIVLGLFEYEPEVDAYITENPVVPAPATELYKNDANIPIIIGHTADELLLSFQGKFNDNTIWQFYNDNIEDIMKQKLKLKDPSKFPDVMKFMREYYLKNKPINEYTQWNLINLLTDYFINLNRKHIDQRNKHANAPTYVYQFSYFGDEPTFYQFDQGPQPLKGVAHADELSYMFYFDYMKEDRDEIEKCPREGTKNRLVVERLIRMWYNFAATGNPTPRTDDRYVTTIWKPSSKENLHYLDIGDELTLRSDKDNKRRIFYDKIKDDFLGFD